MWARIVEVMIACWLALSPFIFHAPKEEKWFWINDFACSFLLAFFSLLCFYKPLRKIHLFNLGVGIWLFSMGYFFPLPLPAYVQNDVVIGLLLLVLTLVPSESEHPPQSWQNFHKKNNSSLI